MDIRFLDNEVREIALSFASLIHTFGKKKGKRIRQRLDEIHAAANLHDLHLLLDKKCHCHPANQEILRIQTEPNSYLLVEQANLGKTINLTAIDWSKVEAVAIISLDGDAT